MAGLKTPHLDSTSTRKRGGGRGHELHEALNDEINYLRGRDVDGKVIRSEEEIFIFSQGRILRRGNFIPPTICFHVGMFSERN